MTMTHYLEIDNEVLILHEFELTRCDIEERKNFMNNIDNCKIVPDFVVYETRPEQFDAFVAFQTEDDYLLYTVAFL